jgi:hypothetical protein
MSEQLSRKERYEKAKKAREDADKAKGGYNPVEVPDFEPLVLSQDKCHVLRLVGEVPEAREKSSDALIIERSFMRSDDGKYFTMIWNQDKDWPFRVLARKLCKYKYEDLGSGKKEKVYEHEGCDLLKYYNTNGKDKPSAYESGMAPSKFILINAIDRMDDWCKENKHTKMLAWDVNEQEDKKYYTWGMKTGLFKEIFDVKCTSIGSHYEDVDLVIRRFSQKNKPADDVYYQVMYDEEKRAIQNWSDKDKVDYMSFVSKEECLTKEELAYERYNLENIPYVSQSTPISIIMNKMEKFIKDVDKKYDWGIWEMMVEWKAKEKEAWSAKKALEKDDEDEPKKSTVKVETNQETDDELPTDIEEKVEEKTKTQKVAKSKKFEITDEMINTFEGLADCPEHIKKHIVAVDVDEMTMTFDIEADATCGNCDQDIPDSFDFCPCCGTTY